MPEKNIAELARRLAEAINEDPVDSEETVTGRDVLDWLASAGLTLELAGDDAASEAYLLQNLDRDE
jgi:hypothetical protein